MAKELCNIEYKYIVVDIEDATKDKVVIYYCIIDSDDDKMHKNSSIELLVDDVDLSTIDRTDAISRVKTIESIV